MAKAKQLLTEAGYPNGFTVRVPSYAALDQKLGAFAQMLAPAGIKVELVQVQSGVIAAEYRQGKWAIGYALPRQAHAFTQYSQYLSTTGTYNPFGLTDPADLPAKAQQAAALDDERRSRSGPRSRRPRSTEVRCSSHGPHRDHRLPGQERPGAGLRRGRAALAPSPRPLVSGEHAGKLGPDTHGRPGRTAPC